MMTKLQWRQRVESAIERRDRLCFDVCANVGQVFDNVKHMRWFKEGLAREMGWGPGLATKRAGGRDG